MFRVNQLTLSHLKEEEEEEEWRLRKEGEPENPDDIRERQDYNEIREKHNVQSKSTYLKERC